MTEKSTIEHLTDFIQYLKNIKDITNGYESMLEPIGQVKHGNEQSVNYLCDLFSNEYLNGDEKPILKGLRNLFFNLTEWQIWQSALCID